MRQFYIKREKWADHTLYDLIMKDINGGTTKLELTITEDSNRRPVGLMVVEADNEAEVMEWKREMKWGEK